jgi:serine/threonine protein kinase
MAVLISHVRDTPRPPYEINPGIYEKLSALVMRALAKNPAERFQSAAEMKRALEDISLEKTRRATTQIMPASLAPGTAAPAVPFWKSAQGGWPALVMAVGIGILIGWLMTARPTYKSAVAIAGSTPGAPHTLSPPSKSPPSKKTASQKTILPIVRKKQTLKRAIAFTRETRKSASLPLGTRKIVQTGHSGVREIVLEIAMQGRQELSRKILTTRVVSAPRKQVELLGTRAPRRAQATAAKSFTTSSASTRRRAGSTSEKSAASLRRVPKSRATFKKKSSPRKLASQKSSSRKSSSAKSSAQNSSKKARSSQDARDRSPGVVPSSQVFGSFRLPGSPGD